MDGEPLSYENFLSKDIPSCDLMILRASTNVRFQVRTAVQKEVPAIEGTFLLINIRLALSNPAASVSRLGPCIIILRTISAVSAVSTTLPF